MRPFPMATRVVLLRMPTAENGMLLCGLHGGQRAAILAQERLFVAEEMSKAVHTTPRAKNEKYVSLRGLCQKGFFDTFACARNAILHE